ncbi:MAG TPA: CHAD domain-containing protein [Verrucomicrobiae bacterium]|nr:CHAD domain-containing protein [Verrucomicrobiae bacterium]
MKDWEVTLQASLKERRKRYRRALKRCRQRGSEKSVHATRVETRRLLSLVELLNIFIGQTQLKKTRSQLKQHLDALRPLRDTHVQLLVLSKLAREFPETKGFHQMLLEREKQCLKAAARRLRGVKIRRLEKVFEGLARQLARVGAQPAQRTPHRTAVLRGVQEAFERTVDRQRAMDPGSANSIHRTRVAFKKFRYMVEALQPILLGVTPARIAALQDFQSMMGDVQDTDVFLARLDKYTRRHHRRARRLARFRHWLLRRRTAQITYCLNHADRLNGFWPLPRQPGGRAEKNGSRRPIPRMHPVAKQSLNHRRRGLLSKAAKAH